MNRAYGEVTKGSVNGKNGEKSIICHLLIGSQRLIMYDEAKNGFEEFPNQSVDSIKSKRS
jgi:hypothetical protein